MNLTGIVAVSGKSGLYKLLARTKSGFVLESLDEAKNKIVADLSNQKFSSLDDITIYSLSDDDIKLCDIFEAISKYSQEIPQPKTASNEALRSFFFDIAPKHDDDRVYISDIKKIINWYHFLKDLPLFTEEKNAPLAEANNSNA